MTFATAGFIDRDALDVDALRTDRYLDALLAAAERRARDVPADPGLDPTIRFAARRLQADLVRIHPSFRFEERLAGQLALVASRLGAGMPPELALLPRPAGEPRPIVPLAAYRAADGGSFAFADSSRTDVPARTSRAAASLPDETAAWPVGLRIPVEDEFDALSFDLERSRASAFLATAGLGGLTRLSGNLAGFVPRRPVLVGGAVTSAALSVAGAMFVAWRRSRPGSDPMTRAVRAAHPVRFGRPARAAALAVSHGGVGGLA